MIAIIDYGAGNLRSVAKAIARLGYEARVTSDPADVLSADVVFLPGVGAAGDTMDSLVSLGMVGPLRSVIEADRPFFGICLGLQVLLTFSEEGGGQGCLDVIPGRVRGLPPRVRVPHIGWNQVVQRVSHPLFAGIPDGANFYFLHSYYADVEDGALVAAETEYGIRFTSVVVRGNLVATQFHPEKSGAVGLRLFDNFLRHYLG